MSAIRIEASDDSPLVILDKEQKHFEISGKSMPEDVVEYYQPVLNWLEDYKKDPLPETVFIFKLIYFNTASSKLIYDLLIALDEIAQSGKKVVIQWYAISTDEDMEEAGHEFASMVDLEFEHLKFDL